MMDIVIKTKLNAYSKMNLDIVDNLHTKSSDRVLSANQGTVIHSMIDDIDGRLSKVERDVSKASIEVVKVEGIKLPVENRTVNITKDNIGYKLETDYVEDTGTLTLKLI